MSKKVFRHTPHRAADAMKIIVGNKTNATIRDLEETLEDIEEKEGIVISIDKDKINGDGWVVQDSDGETYTCTCASNMYQLPETEEYGGVYYPTDQVSVKFTINPVLKTNTITEITSLGEEEKSLDLSKWKHGDKATTVIAKPMSAISISNAIISFNYNNKNEVTANADEVKTDGKKTNINTNTLDINSQEINIQGEKLDDYINKKSQKDLNIINNDDYGIDILQQDNIAQLDLDLHSEYIPGGYENTERILADLMDPSLFPAKMQKRPLLVGDQVHELYIYPNGLVTVKSNNNSQYDNADILGTYNWATMAYAHKNVITITVVQSCSCCSSGVTGSQTYFNYCPICKTWTTLYNKKNHITCSNCHSSWCQGCGHNTKYECANKKYDLKLYNLFSISAIGMPCSYCKDKIPYGKTREYANYCPKCHQWGYLTQETHYEDGEERRFLHCDYCNELYCVNCSISQRQSFIKTFLNDRYNKDEFTRKFGKLTHIRDDING